jgi:hypothetical protein
MSEGLDDDQEAQREAVVEMANLTGGMMGGIFDKSRGSSGVLGLSRPHSTAIWRVRSASAIVAISLGVLAIASPVVLALTVGWVARVTIGLGAAAVAAMVVFVSTYAAERREIARRTAAESDDH